MLLVILKVLVFLLGGNPSLVEEAQNITSYEVTMVIISIFLFDIGDVIWL